MIKYLRNIITLREVAVEHTADEINTLVADCVGNPQITVHDLIDAVKRVLLVDDGVEKNTKGPNVLFLATIRFACQDFGGRIICELVSTHINYRMRKSELAYLWCLRIHRMAHS